MRSGPTLLGNHVEHTKGRIVVLALLIHRPMEHRVVGPGYCGHRGHLCTCIICLPQTFIAFVNDFSVCTCTNILSLRRPLLSGLAVNTQ